MTEFLASLKWSGPCLSLLRHMKSLDPEKPVILHIRHTERAEFAPEDFSRLDSIDARRLVSTDVGKRAAFDFGASLPPGRQFTLFHSYMDRARETAEEVHRGILSVGGKAEIAGEIPRARALSVVDWEANNEWIRVQQQKYGPWPDGGFYQTCRWIAGHRPETIQRPSGEFTREYARIAVQNLREAPSHTFHIYVSHDTWVLALMFHWFAELPHQDGLRFLDGFLMQPETEGLRVWFRDTSRLCEYPYWWPNPGLT